MEGVEARENKQQLSFLLYWVAVVCPSPLSRTKGSESTFSLIRFPPRV